MTCAHNLYDRLSKKPFTDFNFTPGISGEFGKTFKVKKVYYLEEYKKMEENGVN